MKHGEQCIMSYANGDYYSGGFVNGLRSGRGSLKDSHGNHFEGQYEMDEMFQGTFTWKDGSSYEGHFVRNQRSGRGTMTYSNGDIYDGVCLHYYSIMQYLLYY